MRRVLQTLPRKYVRHSSYVAGFFNYKVVGEEMFPFPTHKFDTDESENVQTLIEQIRNNDKDLSLAGSRIADEYGGLGLSHTAHALVCEEIGTSGDTSLLETMQHCGVCSYLLSTVGTKEIKGKYLTAMSDGTAILGWATQEDCGSDISMNTCQATLEGANYTITGTKSCAFAQKATHFIVLAKAKTQAATESGPTEANRNTFFIVKRDAPGVKVERDTVTFEKSTVSDIVGVVGEGFKDRMITLFTEQYVYSAALLGCLKRVLQELRDCVPDKWATNTIASCACTMYAMESSLYALTANLDLPTQDSLLEAALVNAYIQNRANMWLTTLSTATPSSEQLENLYSAARKLLSLMESTDFLNATAVCCGVEDFGLLFQKTSTLQMIQARTARSLGARERIPIKEVDCSAIENSIVSFGTAVEATYVRNTTRVPYEHLVINRLGEAASLLYAASACASRASMCINKRLPTAKTEKQLASAFIASATERVDHLCNECCNVGMTADDMYKRIALEVCEDALASPHKPKQTIQ
ncbi:acyl-CoA dehydrogenase, mitochondrial precursor [Strigomonas culicis]|uniref:Acyl-CoA dehydrogenase, mitochondrial n=1 Tax=Strigomonas culicis TaxID=28005 RepID=S9UZA9_9TRYP|nr:acyl-CoA dehydrogenase, mitochondrial precursor [Strigomonas culicis]EPY23253.1 acyl-CoA dehydrogenase, mitochondrial precursor [Strigomonas culicis]EPY34198.1 acyl-CoA dehydrogenase, mitochondrial precursor [Strigomonas culicis]EPY36162.1 acyl-CoA dehydrogenase, mitochondrial precursor [Strigomonas culicis]|eukprot:EPY19614.1 acyl-CoA dehydrogenase, mitochondrial precursor [Strigomonas culicis]